MRAKKNIYFLNPASSALWLKEQVKRSFHVFDFQAGDETKDDAIFVAGCEGDAVILAQKMNRKRGNPAIAESLESVLRDKAQLTQFLAKNGFRFLPTIEIKSIDDLTIAFPIFLKPKDAAGGFGCSYCETAEHATAAFQRTIGTTNPKTGNPVETLLAQPAMAKDVAEYALNLFCWPDESGRLESVITEVWRYERKSQLDHTTVLLKSYEVPPGLREVALAFAEKLACPGPLHVEAFVEGTAITIFDIGARLAGANMPKYVSTWAKIPSQADYWLAVFAGDRKQLDTLKLPKPEADERLAYFSLKNLPVDGAPNEGYVDYEALDRSLAKLPIRKYELIPIAEKNARVGLTTEVATLIADVYLLADNLISLKTAFKELERIEQEKTFLCYN